MRIHRQPLLRLLNSNIFHRLHSNPLCFIRANLLMQEDRFHQLVTNVVDRVETRHRLLEDHGDLATTNREHLFFAQGDNVTPFEQDAAAVKSSRWAGDQLHGAHGSHALAATRLTNNCQRLLRKQRHIDAIHCLNTRPTRGVVKAHRQICNLQHRSCKTFRAASAGTHGAHRVLCGLVM